MGDRIDTLPVDDTVVNKDDLSLIGALFVDSSKKDVLDTHHSKPHRDLKTVGSELKSSIVGAVLFAIFSSSIFDKLIRSAGCNNEIYVWCAKIICFIISFYILKNRF